MLQCSFTNGKVTDISWAELQQYFWCATQEILFWKCNVVVPYRNNRPVRSIHPSIHPYSKVYFFSLWLNAEQHLSFYYSWLESNFKLRNTKVPIQLYLSAVPWVNVPSYDIPWSNKSNTICYIKIKVEIPNWKCYIANIKHSNTVK